MQVELALLAKNLEMQKQKIDTRKLNRILRIPMDEFLGIIYCLFSESEQFENTISWKS